jgi:hypothetical protein
MKKISEFFAKIQNKQAQKIVIYSIAKEAILNITKIDIPISSIGFSGRVLTLKGIDQAAKSVIFIKKAAILKEIKDKFPRQEVVDIRT